MTIQQQIDGCHAQGGGVAVVPPGEHVCGTLFLRSKVNLHLPDGEQPFLEVQNPTDAPISATIQSPPHTPRYAGFRQQVQIPAGASIRAFMVKRAGTAISRMRTDRSMPDFNQNATRCEDFAGNVSAAVRNAWPTRAGTRILGPFRPFPRYPPGPPAREIKIPISPRSYDSENPTRND